MFWVAFQGYNGGKALSLGTLEQLEAESFGMHGYPTEAEAEAKPNVVPAIAKAQVNAWVFNAQGSLTTHAIGAAENAVPGVKQVAGAVTDVNTFLSRLTSVNTWIRVGEFVLGAMLILAGALHLTGANADLKSIGKTAIGFVK